MDIYSLKYNKKFNNEHLINRAKEGCKESKDMVFRNTIPLVIALAKKWCRRTGLSDLDEIIGVGMIGLTKAFKYFDINRKVRFATFASVAIWREFIREASKSQRSNRTKYEIVSFDVDYYEEDMLSRHETVGDNYAIKAFEEIEDLMYRDRFRKYIKNSRKLNPQQKKVARRFFLNGKSIAEVGREMKFSRQRAHQIFKTTLAQIVEDKKMLAM